MENTLILLLVLIKPIYNNDNDSEIVLFGHTKTSEIFNLVDIIILLIMIVIDILVCLGDLITSAL